jgi:hypothetical protein
MEAIKIIINEIKTAITEGKYDDHLIIPFMSRDLIQNNLINRIQHKLERGGNPMLTDAEINGCIQDAKEAAGTAFHLYIKFGFLEQKEDGTFEITKKGKLAIKHSLLM